MIVVLYLSAIVAANLIVTAFGPAVSVLTAFAFIGLNITARDRLHDAWKGSGLVWKMGALIASGSVISYALNKGAAQIAIASFVAFAASEVVDALVYHRLRKSRWAIRVNGSNAISAGVDSFVFPLIAFGGFLPVIVLGQFVAKVFGGAIWSYLIRPRVAATAAAMLVLAMPASSQIVSVQVGHLIVDDFTDEVVEVYAAAPTFGPIRPNVIMSLPLEGMFDARPTWLAQLSYDPTIGFGFDAGVVDTPFADPTPTVGVHLLRPVGPSMITVIQSYQPEHGTWTAVLKIGLSWFRS